MARTKKLDPIVKEVLDRYGVDPKLALWDCHGTWIIYHKYVEFIGMSAGVVLDTPEIIHSDPASKHVVILVSGGINAGKLPKAWSFGEAAPYNNKNSYPFAMAEKRAKDRVILKLVGLAGHVYTDEDVADIKGGKPVFELESTPAKSPATAGQPDYEGQLRATTTVDDLLAVATIIATDEDLSGSERNRLRSIYADIQTQLKGA